MIEDCRSGRIGVLAAIYPAVWGLGQLYTGGLSDRIGRKPLIAGGMLTQAAAIAWIAIADGFWAWAVGAAVLGAGNGDGLPHPLGGHRGRRSPELGGPGRSGPIGSGVISGSAIGAVVAGVVADAISIDAAIYLVAALTALSGLVVDCAHVRDPPPADPPAPLALGHTVRKTLPESGPAFEIAHRIGCLAHRERKIDDRYDLSGADELLQDHEPFVVGSGSARPRLGR